MGLRLILPKSQFWEFLFGFDLTRIYIAEQFAPRRMDLVCWCPWRLGCLWQPSKKVLWLFVFQIGHDILFFWFTFKISTFSPRLFLIFSDNLEDLLCSLLMIMVVCINTLAFAWNLHNVVLVFAFAFIFVFVFDKNYSRTLQIEDDQGR